MNFDIGGGKSEYLHFDGLVLSKICNVSSRIYRGVLFWKITYSFKNNTRNLFSFRTSRWKLNINRKI